MDLSDTQALAATMTGAAAARSAAWLDALPDARPTVLIVDDNAENLAVLGGLLQTRYRVLAATSGARALAMLRRAPPPDLVLLDVMMPQMNGYELLRRLHALPALADLPAIFVTAMGSAADEERGLALGAVDYITKPLRPAVVLARVGAHLELRAARCRLQGENARLEAEVARRLQENLLIQDGTIRALARLAEMRDNETGHHILRTQAYVGALARRAALRPRFADELDEHAIELITKSAPLHDIGKVGIPDVILRKPGKLSDAEMAVMRTHARLGAEAIARAEEDVLHPIEFLVCAKEIALHHHERWDGAGYPDGLAGESIPLAARLMAIADVFDALIARRVYKRPMPVAQAREIILAGAGTQFDPELVSVFDAAFEEFEAIAQRYPDGERDDAAGPAAATAAGAGA